MNAVAMGNQDVNQCFHALLANGIGGILSASANVENDRQRASLVRLGLPILNCILQLAWGEGKS